MSVQSPVPIALELYTVRDETGHDFPGTVRRVAEMGYDGVEFAGYGALSADEMRDLLRETGLRAAGTHVSLDRLDLDFDAEVQYCHTIGCRELVLPSLPNRLRGRENLRGAIDLLNDLGVRCRDAELRFGYHNHDVEFVPHDGKPLWEHMADTTDPALVFFELDVYWVAYAGYDPRRTLREYAGRIPLVHFKDMDADRHYTEVGAGSLDLDTLYRDGPELGIEWAIVEHDDPTLPSLESGRLSLAALHAARDPR